MIETKKALRKTYKALRQNIPQAYREKAQIDAASHFKNLPHFQTSMHIACYLAYQDEFNADALIQCIWQSKKKCYLPTLNADNSLTFVQYEKGDTLQPNKYQILEPVKHAQFCPSEQLDIVITPLIAFDLFGNRLGTGGGFYDRTFQFLTQNKTKSPKLIGLSFACQQALNIPKDLWDISLDSVITEKEVIDFN